MENELKETIKVLPDFLTDADDETKHFYKRWLSVAYKIDNHELRYYDVINKAGLLKTFDAKGNGSKQYNNVLKFGASIEEATEVKRRCLILQELQKEKSRLNKSWQSRIYVKKGGKSILDVRAQEVIEMFGNFFTVDEVFKTIIDKWEITLPINSLRKFFLDHKEKIDKLRTKYVLEGKDVRLATDAGRLQVLSKLAWEMEKKFDKNKGIESSKELRSIVEQIRKEVKGEEIKLTIDGRIDVNATIQANQTISEALQKLPINLIVIGLTAARQRINPVSLMGLLANSYYSKFSGFNKLNDLSEVELPGKLIKQYNWDEIKQKNDQMIQDVEPIEELEKQVNTESPKFQSNKSKLMQKLEELKAISEGAK